MQLEKVFSTCVRALTCHVIKLYFTTLFLIVLASTVRNLRHFTLDNAKIPQLVCFLQAAKTHVFKCKAPVGV